MGRQASSDRIRGRVFPHFLLGQRSVRARNYRLQFVYVVTTLRLMANGCVEDKLALEELAGNTPKLGAGEHGEASKPDKAVAQNANGTDGTEETQEPEESEYPQAALLIANTHDR